MSRFDGLQFINYSPGLAVLHRINGVDIRAIIEDTVRQLIWTLSTEGGLNAISTRTGYVVQTHPLPRAGSDEWGMTMMLSGDNLWIGLSTGLTIFNLQRGQFEKSPELPAGAKNIHDYECSCLTVDTKGHVWAFFSGWGTVVYDALSHCPIRSIPMQQWYDKLHSGNIRFYSCASTGVHKMLCGTAQGLRAAIWDDQWNVKIDPTPCRAVPELNKVSVESICKGADGQVWIAAHTGLYVCDTGLEHCRELVDRQADDAGLWTPAVQNILFDDRGNAWLGCQQGLASLKRQPIPFSGFYRNREGSRM